MRLSCFVENLGFKNHIYIIGGGHCALALSELMSKLDFHLTLFDDRADLNTFTKNRFVHQKLTLDTYENIPPIDPFRERCVRSRHDCWLPDG